MLGLFVHTIKILCGQFILLFGERRKMTHFRSFHLLQYGALAQRRWSQAYYWDELFIVQSGILWIYIEKVALFF